MMLCSQTSFSFQGFKPRVILTALTPKHAHILHDNKSNRGAHLLRPLKCAISFVETIVVHIVQLQLIETLRNIVIA